MREVTILSNPVAEPGVCMKCGSQERDWFVDIGIDIDYNENRSGLKLWLDGIAYLCCDCLNNLYTDVHKRFSQFEETRDIEVYPHGIERTDISNEISIGSERDYQELDGSPEPSPVPAPSFGFGSS